jgi:hypothetical protein
MKEANQKAAGAIHLHDSEFSSAAGICFSKKTLQVISRILPCPKIVYKREIKKVDDAEAKWRMGDLYRASDCDVSFKSQLNMLLELCCLFDF